MSADSRQATDDYSRGRFGPRSGIPAARALRGALALAAVIGATLLISLVWDLPDIHDTGLFGQLYADASAAPHIGYYAETLGGILLLAAGGGMLLIPRARSRQGPSR